MKQREIKFRVWSRKAKIMFTVDEIMWKLGKLLHIRGRYKDNRPIGGHADYIKIDKDIILMQYTGLKDRKGVEIYEGDIVKPNGQWYSEKEGYPYIQGGSGIVEYRDGEYIVKCPKRKNDKIAYLRDAKIGSKFIFEVIGNIYENPELLT